MPKPYQPHPREQIVYEGIDSCSYLENERMRTPLRYQFDNFTPWDFDASLAGGDRRVGRMVYRTDCPSCHACEPIRVPVQDFTRSKSQRRIFNRNQDVRVMMAPARFSEDKLALFNRHKMERGLSKNERAYQRGQYERWLIESCTDTREFQYYLGDDLIGVSILDFGASDISSVYFYFDPDHNDRSLGTFSALFEIEWMKQQSMRFYYLGLYVESCSHLNYKARYFPHQRLIQDDWRVFANRQVSIEDSVIVDDLGDPITR
jgi:arginine-tRNA-protein transferase